ncbi:MAG: citrate:H+ symporter, partial [Deltaproteobacteria bacterium]|nr:citrate:H+ symporter [Deltaproteobacteria bacterium]
MTETYLSIAGFIMVGVIVWGLIQSKITPVPIFVLISTLVGIMVMTPDFAGLFKAIDGGVRSTMPIAVLFIFSIIYFSLMNDVGLFDPFVNFLVKRAGTNVVLITVVTSLIAIIAHLDGALASTLLITVPAMLPIYKRLNMRPLVLLVIIGAAMSIMNLLPWGGPVARTAAITKLDINLLWRGLIPLQIAGCFLVAGFAAFMGLLEKRRGAGLSRDAVGHVVETEEADPKKDALKRPRLIWFNALVTLAVILLLCFTKIPLY